MECDACGSHNVLQRTIEEHLVEECQLCGHLQGDDAAVRAIEELQDGRERGFDDAVIPLVHALESTEVFRVVRASPAPGALRESPQVLFRLDKGETAYLEHLMRAIEFSNRTTKRRWIVELSLQHELLYVLKPRFMKPPTDVTPAEIEQACADLPRLARSLRRDLGRGQLR